MKKRANPLAGGSGHAGLPKTTPFRRQGRPPKRCRFVQWVLNPNLLLFFFTLCFFQKRRYSLPFLSYARWSGFPGRLAFCRRLPHHHNFGGQRRVGRRPSSCFEVLKTPTFGASPATGKGTSISPSGQASTTGEHSDDGSARVRCNLGKWRGC